MVRIVVDTLGSDAGPAALVCGAVSAMKELPDLSIAFTGDSSIISELLQHSEIPSDRYEIIHAPDAVSGEDRPIDAIRLKKESSMMKAVNLLRERSDIDGMVSAGATGCLVGAATMRIGRIENIRRPAFCPILPTMDGGIVGISDSGANVECSPEMLLQFAIMASSYLEGVYHIKSPRVALLNVGTESEKGDDMHREAYMLLSKEKGINFVGNMESRDLLSGKYDLVVCDGFSGKVLIKATEGTALELLKKLKKDIYSRLIYKMGALLMKKMFDDEKKFMDYQNYGGSVLLGCEKIIVKGHGSAKDYSIKQSVYQAYNAIKCRLIDTISEKVASYGENGLN